MNLQTTSFCSNTNRWELAQRISGHAKTPEQALESIFKGIVQQLEESAEIKLETFTKDKIWSIVSNERLDVLKSTLINEFCEKILGDFNENQVGEMLEDHKTKDFTQIGCYSQKINKLYADNQESIIETVVTKANSFTNDLIPEIIEALKNEGIELFS